MDARSSRRWHTINANIPFLMTRKSLVGELIFVGFTSIKEAMIVV